MVTVDETMFQNHQVTLEIVAENAVIVALAFNVSTTCAKSEMMIVLAMEVWVTFVIGQDHASGAMNAALAVTEDYDASQGKTVSEATSMIAVMSLVLARTGSNVNAPMMDTTAVNTQINAEK